MKRRERHLRKVWGSRAAATFALAIAIVMAGTFRPAEAATFSAYVPVWSDGDSVAAITGNSDTLADVQTDPVSGYAESGPLYLGANPAGTRVYVPNRFSNIPVAPVRTGVGVRASISGFGNVSVIDTATDTVVATIEHSSFDEPVAVAVSPDGTEIWVVSSSSETGNIRVSIFDNTNAFIGTVTDPDETGCFRNNFGGTVSNIAFNPDLEMAEAYLVGNPDGEAVCIMNTTSRSITDYVWAEAGANYVAVTPNGSKVFVSGDAVTIIEAATGNSRTISPYDLSTVTYLAVSNDGTKIYAAGNDYFLEIIDSSNADFNDDDFADSYVDFSNASVINAVAVVPGTDIGLVTDTEMSEAYAFDTVNDEEILIDGSPVSVSLNGTPKAIIAIGQGGPPPPPPTPTLTLQNGGMGAGWFGSCGMVVGRDGKGPMSGAESAGMIALYFALLLLPVGILKLVYGKKRFPFEKAGIVALFIVASMLVASSAHATRLIVPKAQRFHPTMDGLGALTVDTDQTLCTGQFNFGLTLSGAKKPLDMGNLRELRIEKVVVDELYTADLTVAYGITPDITLGLDVPYDFSRDNLNYADYIRNGPPGVRDDVFHLGDIRVNAKFRVIDGGRYGLALIPFVNFDTGDKDYLLSEGKIGFGMKLAGHFDVIKPLAIYANLGAEQIGKFVSPDGPDYYTPWIQYGVGARFLLPWRNDSIVAEVNGETSWATPFRHSTLSPLEVLAAYRAEIAPGWTLQAGGGGGLNKGMGAPQWRAILGIAYKM